MTRYTDDSKEQVRDAVDMVDLVSSHTDLRKAGADRYEGLCPFHEERTPSFGMSPSKGIYHCFGCGAGGDAFKFVEEREGLDFKEALELLADRYGVELELDDEDPRAAERRQQRERLLELLERTAALLRALPVGVRRGSAAREYLAGARARGGRSCASSASATRPSAWDKVLARVAPHGLRRPRALRRRPGAAQQGRGPHLRPLPRADHVPAVRRARAGARLRGARAGAPTQQPKYLNSSENEIFHKGRNLFGADIARAHAAKAGTVIVAEGYTDVIAMHQAGIRNAVGLMGTALTEDQVGELGRLAPVVQLALDADSAGQEAMLRAARLAAGRKLELRVVPLPAGQRPRRPRGRAGGGRGPRARRRIGPVRALPGRARARASATCAAPRARTG